MFLYVFGKFVEEEHVGHIQEFAVEKGVVESPPPVVVDGGDGIGLALVEGFVGGGGTIVDLHVANGMTDGMDGVFHA